jgi:hypothetical protein
MVETSQIGRKIARKRVRKAMAAAVLPPRLTGAEGAARLVQSGTFGAWAHRDNIGDSSGLTLGASSAIERTPTTGAQLLAYWDAEDVGGVYADKRKYPGNAQETARVLRQREEARE